MAKTPDIEVKTFRKNRDNLLLKHEGKFVLIKGNNIIDIYNTYKEALKVAKERYNEDKFMIFKISRDNEQSDFDELLDEDLEKFKNAWGKLSDL